MIHPRKVSSKFLSVAALLGLCTSYAQAIDLTASTGSTLTYYNETVTVDPGFVLTHTDPTISGFKVIIANPETGDALNFTTQNGITGSYDAVNFVLTLSGDTTIENYQTALRTVTLSTTNTAAGNRNISFAIDSDNVATIYNSLNGHFYQYRTTYPTGGSAPYGDGGTVDCSGTGFGARAIDDGISWTESKDAAAQFSYFGWTGYLATISSADENAFLFSQINNTAAWIGASDNPAETVSGIAGDWEWVTGPEAGTLFWQEVDGTAFNSRPATGSAQGGNYSNWHNASGIEEPNNYSNFADSPAEGESYAHFFGDQGGTWNDMPNIEGLYKSCGYLVEFGGMPGDTATLAAQKVVNVATINQAPTATNPTLSATEDLDYTFTVADFNFSDPDGGDARLDHITIKSLPNPGTLTLNGSTVNIGDTVSNEQITTLVFSSVEHENGAGYTSFDYSVNDGFEDSVSDYTATMDVSAVNDTPTMTVTLGANITENSANDSTVVASFSSTDPDGTPVIDFTPATNTDSYYEIVGTTVELTTAGANFVNAGNALPSLSLTATDDTDNAKSTVDAQTPVITPTNDTPTLTLTLGADIDEEAASNSTVVASFVASDEDGTPTVGFTAGTNNDGYYEIVGTNVELSDAGALFVNESGALPSLSLTATDDSNGALTGADSKVPVITSSNDTPTITVTLGGAIVEGTATNATVVANFVASDEDGTPTVAFTSGSNDDGYYEIVGTSVELTQDGADFVNAGNDLPALSLTATDDSDGALTAADSKTPVTTESNDSPSISITLGSAITENSATDSTVVASFVASDEDGTPTVDFTAGSNSDNYYEIVATNVELTQAGADFVNAGGALPALSLTATDDTDGALTTVSAVNPVVTLVNDTPVLTLTLGDTIVENSASDTTIVASFVSTDEESTPSVDFTAGTNTENYYEIVGTNIELTQTGADFVNNQGALPAISLTTTDGNDGAITTSDSKTPVITPSNDSPNLSVTIGSTVVEGSATDASVVASFIASDEEGTPTVSFTTGSNSEGYYEIVGSNVELTQAGADFVNGGGLLPPFSLTVTDDTDGALTNAVLTEPVTNTSNDTPEITITLGGAIVENDATDATIVASFVASDEDGTPTVSFTTDTNTEGYYEIVGTNIELTQAGADFVNGGGTLPPLSLTVTDDSNSAVTNTDSKTPVISATNDTPSIVITLADALVQGTANETSVVASFAANDEENSPSVSFTAGTNTEGYYEIVGSNIELTQAGADLVNAGGSLPAISLTVTDETDGLLTAESSQTPTILPSTDKDSDGIPDTDEGTEDTDGDGIPNDEDTDSDNDGISDQDEGVSDSDGDGTPDYLDSSKDEDGDGIPDIVEGTDDIDGDGKPNFNDSDSDNDGISDGEEAGVSGLDSDSDGVDDSFDIDQTEGVDLDSDGIDDSVSLLDSDEDGTPDYLDRDSDNDGIPDALESAFSNSDVDQDGIVNSLDSDSDNDGIADSAEGNASGVDTDADGIDDHFDVDSTGGTDSNGDGVDDDVNLIDTDGDNVPDLHDLDTDNDGIFDTTEANVSDVDINGIADNQEELTLSPIDSDSDGTADYRDLDSDNDGTNDIEATAAGVLDTDNNGQIDFTGDTDGDGIDDLWDQQPESIGSAGDQDGDDIPDSVDTDKDGDGIPNSEEGSGDSDGDGIPDDSDLDSDNDGLTDAEESSAIDSDIDGDGIANHLDTDSDNDGILDQIESRGDLDNDGVANYLDRDSDNDGISDMNESAAGTGTNGDLDSDSILDYLDKDSDNDGLSDAFESGRPAPAGNDADQDGIDDAYDVDITEGTDTDADGIDDSFSAIDTDSDSVPNYRDSDSDGDGIPDSEEQTLVILKNTDSDGDGIDDAFDVDITNGIDENGDGVDDNLINNIDLDGDGLLAYLDTDTDGDGYSDTLEYADYDNNGVMDYVQVDTGRVKTGVRGGGASDTLFALILLCFASLRFRQITTKRS